MPFSKLRAKALLAKKRYDDLFSYLVKPPGGLEHFFSLIEKDENLAIWYAGIQDETLRHIFANSETEAIARRWCRENGHDEAFLDFLKPAYRTETNAQKPFIH